MKLDASQANRVREAFDSVQVVHSTGGSNKKIAAGKKPKEMSQAEIATKENQKKVCGCINQLGSKLKDLKKAILLLKTSKHPVAKVCVESLKEHDKKLNGHMTTLQQADVDENYTKATLKVVFVAEEEMKKTAADLKLGKSIK